MSLSNGHTNGVEKSEDGYVVVVDEENYSHTRRQKIIEDKREHAIDVRTDARGQQIAGEISKTESLQYYRGALESYILQIIPVLRRDDIDVEDDYLEATELGEVTFTPPSELVQFAEENIERLVPGSKIPRSETYPVKGLVSIVEMPSPLSHEFSVSIRDGGDIRTESVVVEHELPQSVLDKAMEVADQALDEVNIGIEVDDSNDEGEFDYSDLIEENGELSGINASRFDEALNKVEN
jgi:hypothetical protein